MDLSKLSLSDKIMGATGIVLIISLLVLPWHDVEAGPFSVTRSATESPNGIYGVLALLLTIAIVVVLALRVFKPDTALPDLPVSWDRALFFAAAAVLVLLVLKLIVETEFLGFGAWFSLLLAAGLTYGGYLRFQADTGATTAR